MVITEREIRVKVEMRVTNFEWLMGSMLPTHGKNMFFSPSICNADPVQVSGSMVTTPRLGHGSWRVRTPSSRMSLRALCAGTWAFASSGSGPQATEPCVCGLGRSGGRPCASPMGVLPWCARQCRAPLAHRAPRFLALELLQRPSYVGGGSDQPGGWWIVVSVPSSGGGVSYGGGSKYAPRSGSGVASVPVLMASELCILAASGSVGGGGDGKVSDPASSCVAGQLTPGSCSSTRGSMSPAILVTSLAAPSFSTSSG
jgi:hypothetical protein